MKNTVLSDIVNFAKANGMDPVAVVEEYFLEKDRRITRSEAAGIVSRLSQVKDTRNHQTTWVAVDPDEYL